MTADRRDFERSYLRQHGRYLTYVLLLGVSAILATSMLDVAFQPEVSRELWYPRGLLATLMLAITVLASIPAMRDYRQPLIVVFTLLGCVAVLEFAARSVEPYPHYYDNAVVLIAVFCFMLGRLLFRWGLICAGLLFLVCNLYWLALNPQPVDLLIIKNFILALACIFSLAAAWILEQSLYINFQKERLLKEERDQLNQIQSRLERQNHHNEALAQYRELISGDPELSSLGQLTLSFMAQLWPIGHGEILQVNNEQLIRLAGYAKGPLPANHEPVSMGEGLNGEVARSGSALVLDNLPSGYLRVQSSMGDTSQAHLLIYPALYEHQCHGVVELALLEKPEQHDLALLQALVDCLAQALAMAQLRRQNSASRAAP